MGLFDSLKEQAMFAMAKRMGLPADMLNSFQALLKDSGGLEGFMKKFKELGLENATTITSAQIKALLGEAQVNAIAQKAGMSVEALCESMSKSLPQVSQMLKGANPGNMADLFKKGMSAMKDGKF